jgi:hypothetical protein
VPHDDVAGGRVELARGFQQHVAEEVAGVGFLGQALEVAADDGIGLRQFRHALLGGLLRARGARLDEPLAVQARADDAGGGFERGDFGRIDRPALAGIVESQRTEEAVVDEDRHHGLGQRAAIRILLHRRRRCCVAGWGFRSRCDPARSSRAGALEMVLPPGSRSLFGSAHVGGDARARPTPRRRSSRAPRLGARLQRDQS